MSTPVKLTADQIHKGDTLPELAYEVTATTVVLGALATRDWRPMHHDYDFAVNRNGVKDIFLNTPNQAHWFERYITDWTGPHGRLGRMVFRMQDSVFPGDRMIYRGTVLNLETDDRGCCWVDIDVKLTVDDRVCSTCAVRVAVPADANDNPWRRSGDDWKPKP
jgi:acyl dehydratase